MRDCVGSHPRAVGRSGQESSWSLYNKQFAILDLWSLGDQNGPVVDGDFNRQFGAIVRERRDRAGLTQQDLADRLSLSRTSVVNIEQGRQGIPLASLPKFAEALGCSAAQLLPSIAAEPSVTYRLGESDDDARTFLAKVANRPTRGT